MKKSKSEILLYTLGIGTTAKGVGNFGPFGLVSLTRMKKPAKIGGEVDDKNLDGPTARVLFSTAASVDSLIAELKPVARKMRAYEKSMIRAAKKLKTKPLEITLNATVPDSPRHPNKQRKPSRKGTKR